MIPLSPRTTAHIERIFTPEEVPEATRLLSDECGDNLLFCDLGTPVTAERIRFAVLKLSEGSMSELKTWIQQSKIEWRDVLMAAGFATEVTAHLDWNPKHR